MLIIHPHLPLTERKYELDDADADSNMYDDTGSDPTIASQIQFMLASALIVRLLMRKVDLYVRLSTAVAAEIATRESDVSALLFLLQVKSTETGVLT